MSEDRDIAYGLPKDFVLVPLFLAYINDMLHCEHGNGAVLLFLETDTLKFKTYCSHYRSKHAKHHDRMIG